MKLELKNEEVEFLLDILSNIDDDDAGPTYEGWKSVRMLNLISIIEYQYGKSKL